MHTKCIGFSFFLRKTFSFFSNNVMKQTFLLWCIRVFCIARSSSYSKEAGAGWLEALLKDVHRPQIENESSDDKPLGALSMSARRKKTSIDFDFVLKKRDIHSCCPSWPPLMPSKTSVLPESYLFLLSHCNETLFLSNSLLKINYPLFVTNCLSLCLKCHSTLKRERNYKRPRGTFFLTFGDIDAVFAARILVFRRGWRLNWRLSDLGVGLGLVIGISHCTRVENVGHFVHNTALDDGPHFGDGASAVRGRGWGRRIIVSIQFVRRLLLLPLLLLGNKQKKGLRLNLQQRKIMFSALISR